VLWSLAPCLLVCSTLTLAGCGGAGGAGDAGRTPTVVATTSQVADFTRVVGGDAVRVHQVLRPGTDPHEFEPSPADQEAIRHARAVFENGLGLESWVGGAVKAAGAKGPVVDASRGASLRRASQEGRETDPHIWQDPANAKVMVANIASGLAAALPERAADFSSRAVAYEAELDALDADVRHQIDTIPPPQRKLVTNHDALGYFTDRYAITLVGSVIPSFDSQAELSSRQLSALVATIRAQGVKAIFAETSLPAKTARTVARDAGVKVVDGEDSLYSDSLGPAGSDGDTYLKMVRHNTRQLVANLG
jgi:zinc/manganese transport system substrate-binding protein/manganese/iron transport system substrate-binding protein